MYLYIYIYIYFGWKEERKERGERRERENLNEVRKRVLSLMCVHKTQIVKLEKVEIFGLI